MQIVVAIARAAAGAAGILAILACLLILSDGIPVGTGWVSASNYYFGTDVFEAKGGWVYRSRHHYLAASLLEGTPLLVGGAIALFEVLRRRLNVFIIGAGLIAIGIGANIFRMWCTESWFLGTHQFCG